MPPPTYTVADVIGRNPDDVCMLAYHSGHWSEWLKPDGSEHHARRFQQAAMEWQATFDAIKDPATRDDWFIRLEHGQPIRFGADKTKAVIRDAYGNLTVEHDVAEGDPRVVIHDAHATDPSYAFALSRLQSIDVRYSPMGVLRDTQRPVYDEQMSAQLDEARAAAKPDEDALATLLRGKDTWVVA